MRRPAQSTRQVDAAQQVDLRFGGRTKRTEGPGPGSWVVPPPPLLCDRAGPASQRGARPASSRATAPAPEAFAGVSSGFICGARLRISAYRRLPKSNGCYPASLGEADASTYTNEKGSSPCRFMSVACLASAGGDRLPCWARVGAQDAATLAPTDRGDATAFATTFAGAWNAATPTRDALYTRCVSIGRSVRTRRKRRDRNSDAGLCRHSRASYPAIELAAGDTIISEFAIGCWKPISWECTSQTTVLDGNQRDADGAANREQWGEAITLVASSSRAPPARFPVARPPRPHELIVHTVGLSV